MRLLIIIATTLYTTLSVAATFSNNNGIGSSTIGSTPGSDYPSLAVAAGDFNNYSGGMTGNYTFYINSDLNEPTDVGFGNSTNGFTLTFKPAVGATPTIRFSSTAPAANAYLGKWLFGVTGTNNTITDTYRLGMPNIVIDGSNSPGGTSRDLTVTNTPEDTLGSTNYFSVLLFVGDCDNTIVKNCRLHQVAESSNVLRQASALQFLSRTLITPAAYLVPDSPTVQNCEIKSHGPNSSIGITFHASTSAGANNRIYFIASAMIRNCDFDTQFHGIFLNNNSSFTVEDCRFRIHQTGTNANGFSAAISHDAANTDTIWTSTIQRNWIKTMRSASSNSGGGLTAFSFKSNSTGNFTYRIHNNMIGGFQFDEGAAPNSRYNLIQSTTSGGNIELLHNSINMPNINGLSPVTGKAAMISLENTTANMNVKVRNNIIRYLQNTVNANVYYANNNPSATYPPDWDYNDIITAAPTFARIGVGPTNTFTTLANWQASAPAGRDNNSFSIDPFLTSGSKWTSDSDLHFTPNHLRPQGLLPVPHLALVTIDADKENRSAIAGQNYPGADYLTAAPLPVSVSGFTVE